MHAFCRIDAAPLVKSFGGQTDLAYWSKSSRLMCNDPWFSPNTAVLSYLRSLLLAFNYSRSLIGCIKA